MKKIILLCSTGLITLLLAKPTESASNPKSVYAHSAQEAVILDSLLTIEFSLDSLRNDSVLYIYHQRDPQTQYIMGYNSYFIYHGVKVNNFRLESTREAFEDSILYTRYYHSWVSSTEQWTPSSKELVTFKEDSMLTRTLSFTWNYTSKTYVSDRKIVVVNNSNNQPLLEEEYIWNVPLQQWRKLTKATYTYDANGNRTSKITYVGNEAGEWSRAGREIHEYDAQGKETSDTLYTLVNNIFDLNYAGAFKYDDEGRLQTKTVYNKVNGSLQVKNVFYYYYPSKDSVLLIETQRSGDTLANYLKWERSYVGNKLQSETKYEWNLKDALWVPVNRKVFELWEGPEASYDQYYWNTANKSWDVYFFEKYYYATQVVAVQDISVDVGAWAYPNPAKHKITLNVGQLQEYSLYDAQGHVLLHGSTPQVDVQALKEGTYMLSIKAKDKVYLHRFVKID